MVFRYILCLHIVITELTPLIQGIHIIPEPSIVMSTKFVPKIKVKMCFLKPDLGPCRANIKMFFFNSSTEKCESFIWGGCQGNGNRFDSRRQCEDACLTKPDTPKTKPRYCLLAFDYGFCFGDVKRWHYDKTWKVCKERIYSGCGGNKNNFYSLEQCDSICRLAKGSLNKAKKTRTGVRKVVYVFSNVTTTTKWTIPEHNRSKATSPKPRYGRKPS